MTFEPLRPLAALVDFIVYKQSGGRWLYELDLVATDPEPDDVIQIDAEMGRSESVQFRLTNGLPAYATFNAYFSGTCFPCVSSRLNNIGRPDKILLIMIVLFWSCSGIGLRVFGVPHQRCVGTLWTRRHHLCGHFHAGALRQTGHRSSDHRGMRGKTTDKIYSLLPGLRAVVDVICVLTAWCV